MGEHGGSKKKGERGGKIILCMIYNRETPFGFLSLQPTGLRKPHGTNSEISLLSYNHLSVWRQGTYCAVVFIYIQPCDSYRQPRSTVRQYLIPLVRGLTDAPHIYESAVLPREMKIRVPNPSPLREYSLSHDTHTEYLIG